MFRKTKLHIIHAAGTVRAGENQVEIWRYIGRIAEKLLVRLAH